MLNGQGCGTTKQTVKALTDFNFCKNLVFTAEKYPNKDLIIEEMETIFCRTHFFLIKKKNCHVFST